MSKHRLRVAAPGFCAATFLFASAAAAGTPTVSVATWTGAGGDTAWTNPLNWDLGVVPNNTADNLFEVVIPAGVPRLTTQGVLEVNSLYLGAGSELDVFTSLTVRHDATIAGRVETHLGGVFVAHGVGSALIGPTARLRTASATSRIEFGASSISGAAVGQQWSMFTTDAAGSSIAFPNLVTIDDRFDDGTSSATTHGFGIGAGTSADFPLLQSVHGAVRPEDRLQIGVGAGAAVSAPKLETIDGSTRLLLGGTLALPSLTTLRTTEIRYTSGNSALIAPHVVDMDGSTVSVVEGTAFTAPLVTSYSTAGVFPESGNVVTLFEARGAGSLISLPALHTLDATAATGAVRENLRASEGGLLDLSGLRTLRGPETHLRAVDVLFQAGGTIDLSGLQTSTGRVSFRFSDTTADLSSLQVAQNATFEVGEGLTITTPMLVDMSASRFLLQDNARYQSVAESYSAHGLILHPNDTTVDLMFAQQGSVLDLSSLEHLDPSFQDPLGVGRVIRFRTQQGTIDLRGLRSIAPSSGASQFEFSFDNGGSMFFRDITLPRGVAATFGGGGLLHVDGDLRIGPGSTIRSVSSSTPDNTEIRVTGDFIVETPLPDGWGAGAVTVAVDGPGVHMLEVTSIDRGAAPPHFAFPPSHLGRLEVGADSAAATVVLMDAFSNGGTAGSEALYLWHHQVDDSLRILGGSTLVIGDINVYARVDGALVHINSLFPDDVDRIAFGDGFIAIPSPPSCAIALTVTAAGVLRRRRRLAGR